MNARFDLKTFDWRALMACLIGLSVLSACASSEPKSKSAKRPRSTEYFAESEYGVKASPRVSNLRTRLPRGGGRDQLGRPYKVRGQWYHPKEQPGYAKKGKASWYGDAFHGRLTANGEIYDMTHLTAAHPTMPLPSYARVTNTKNGSSIIVRVNDRGPYAHGRIIDLSRRAAEMLDYTHSGVADVKVEYVSRAPLHGRDDSYLLASYRPGKGAADPSDGLPTGVMIAMAGPTPTVGVSAPSGAFVLSQQGSVALASAVDGSSVDLPEIGPFIEDRPVAGITRPIASAGDPALGYAPRETSAGAVAALSSMAASLAATSGAAGRGQGATQAGSATETIHVGTYTSLAEAEAQARAAARLGRTTIEGVDGSAYSLTLAVDGAADEHLGQLWASGQTDAFVIRQN